MKISDKKFVAIKPTDLFLQLIAIPQRENNIERLFNYELTTFPMSFFKDGLMWKTKKANLRNTLLTKNVDIDPNSYHVLDGGTLLHKVRWPTSVTFGDVCKLYVDHITSEHGIRTIAFDGYINTRSTKDHQYARRSINNRGCADVQCDVSTKVNIKQDVFLSNNTKKSRFIDILSSYLTKSRNKVIKADGDADTEIARCGLHVAETGRRVNIVADDTDLALLLSHHWKSGMVDITFTSEKSKAIFDISSSLLEMPANIKQYLLVLHTWIGCDSKSSLTKKLETSQHLRSLMGALSGRNADQAEVGDV